MEEPSGPGGIVGFLIWIVQNIAGAFYSAGWAITHPADWLDWSNKESLVRFIYYGGSVEFFFFVLTAFLLLTIIGIWRGQVLWGYVRVVEWFGNSVGRFFAWAGLIMVLQQTMIVFLQRIFLVSEISMGPFGTMFTKDLSWFSEELKLYNAMVVSLCCAYTFIQGGHVRVDLVYGAISRRRKKYIDMFGALFFMVPVLVLTWMYSWFFLWRHLITPKISASDQLDLIMRKATIVKWNVETIGFSPNGFNAYFLFKVLILAFVFMMFLQAMAFFYRNFMELREGEASDDKYLDRDVQTDDGLTHAAQ
ncbi:TRAP transporter small permease subunit [Qingshengfaniella alkalisoli]|uniref:TRAP transporter small permease protein n=1 Tax=Qingshengfaniella alkalisoli TaxID=2599296 RepID=A0A5B8J2V7_9RHOB|nr:TRAP transporter small permease subunit [Qingshengfaniella alkalisoli]QDY68857.1 C4-dicarboxylate ABC transporter permease [Qingshengfaniella alkalisoli]